MAETAVSHVTSPRSCYYCKQPACSPPTLCAEPTTPSSPLFMQRKHRRDKATAIVRPKLPITPRKAKLHTSPKTTTPPNPHHLFNKNDRTAAPLWACLFITRIFMQPATAQGCYMNNNNKLVACAGGLSMHNTRIVVIHVHLT